MALEYYIDIDCELKKQSGGMLNLIAYVKDWNTIEPMAKAIREHEPGSDIYNQKVTRAVFRPGSPLQESATTTFGEMIHRVEWLNSWIPYCSQCKNCFCKDNKIVDITFKDLRTFQFSSSPEVLCGCYNQIKYPISETLEMLLGTAIALSGNYQKGQPESMLVYYILENAVDGEEIRYSRMQGMFERKTGIVVPIPSSPYDGHVSTDQVFDLIFHYDATPLTVLHILAPFTTVVSRVLFNYLDKKGNMILQDRSCRNFIRFISGVQRAAASKANIVVLP